MKNAFEKHLEQLNKREIMLTEPPKGAVKQAVLPLVDKVSEKIPQKLINTIETAFNKSFELVFNKGSEIISKSYNSDSLYTEFLMNNIEITRNPKRKTFRKFSRGVAKSGNSAKVISGISGAGLGALGIGLPDIPGVIITLLRVVYQTAERCGFNCNNEAERILALRIIRTAVSTPDNAAENRINLWKQVAHIESDNFDDAADINEEIKITSAALAATVLTSKFIQGAPVIGVIGGVANFSLVSRIGEYASVVYQKRYLKSIRNQIPQTEERFLDKLMNLFN